MTDSRKPLRRLRRKQDQALGRYSEAVRSDLSKVDRLKFKAIVVIEIHARDVIERMYRTSEYDFIRAQREFPIPAEDVTAAIPHSSSSRIFARYRLVRRVRIYSTKV